MKKRTLSWALLSALMLALPSLCLTSCGGDDDDDGNDSNSSTTAGVVNPETGLRIISISEGYTTYRYSYDSNGRLFAIVGDGESCTISYNPAKIYISEDSEEGPYNVSFNNKGYISSMNQTWNYTDTDGYQYSGSLHRSFSYDKNGHLTTISTSYKELDNEYSENVTYTWNNNLLTSVVCKGSEGDLTVKTDFEYNNEEYTNKFLQIIPTLLWDGVFSCFIQDNPYNYLNDYLACAGFFGKGPDRLPSSCTYTANGSDFEDIYHDSYSYSYNEEGAIAGVRIYEKTGNYISGYSLHRNYSFVYGSELPN